MLCTSGFFTALVLRVEKIEGLPKQGAEWSGSMLYEVGSFQCLSNSCSEFNLRGSSRLQRKNWP